MHYLGHCQIAELLAHTDELVDYAFKLAQGLDLLAIKRNHRRVLQAHGKSLAALLAGEQGIRAAFDDGAVGVPDLQELVSEGSSSQLVPVGQLLQEGLATVFQA